MLTAMTTPAVSICIPTYNHPELLRQAVQSCVDQTFGDFEIVITDNSDGDASERVIRQLGDPRIRYHRNEKNLGGAGNFTKALALARGHYVKWLMDDDLMKPAFLARTVACGPDRGGPRHPSDRRCRHGAQGSARRARPPHDTALYAIRNTSDPRR